MVQHNQPPLVVRCSMLQAHRRSPEYHLMVPIPASGIKQDLCMGSANRLPLRIKTGNGGSLSMAKFVPGKSLSSLSEVDSGSESLPLPIRMTKL